jgi:hypothetical protein
MTEEVEDYSYPLPACLTLPFELAQQHGMKRILYKPPNHATGVGSNYVQYSFNM